MRLQLGLAMGLALVLVMVPLYLWRRPRADSDPIRIAQASATASTPVVSLQAQPSTAAGAGSGSAPGAPGKDVGLGPARVVSCHDPGSKKTKPEACDHLETFDLAFAKALQESSGCAEDKSSYVLTYVADVSFARKKNPITLSATKDGHTVRASKGTYGPCVAQIKKKLEAVNLEGVKHEHSRYKVEIVATYPASGKP
jgi:hypothetical protein